MSNTPDLSRDGVAVDVTILAYVTPSTSPTKELRRLGVLASQQLRRGDRPWLGLALASVTVLVAMLLKFHVFSPDLWRSGAVYASLPLKSELARLPMSLFLPTPYLPLWAASSQILIVFGLGELILGRWLTLMVATVGHFGSSLVVYVLLNSVHGNVLGLTPALAHALDTGPSAATTAVGACLLIAARMRRCAGLLTLALVAAALIAPGVDGVEHTVALGCGLLAGAAYRVVVSRTTSLANARPRTVWSFRLVRIAQAFRSPRSAVAAIRGRN